MLTRWASGPIAVASALKQVQTKTRFRIVPSAKTKPRITGIARLGHRLTATTGVWYEKPSGYTFRWLGCNGHGNDCRPLPGATGRTLALGRSELGLRLRVVVTAHTGSGAGSASSTATALVRS